MTRAADEPASRLDAAAWYRSLDAELRSRGLSPHEAERATADTRAEAEAAGLDPTTMFGPAVL